MIGVFSENFRTDPLTSLKGDGQVLKPFGGPVQFEPRKHPSDLDPPFASKLYCWAQPAPLNARISAARAPKLPCRFTSKTGRGTSGPGPKADCTATTGPAFV
jgi:hypothetical protein